MVGNAARVLVTGANGFVGHHLCTTLSQRGYIVRASQRKTGGVGAENVVIDDVGPATDWTYALREIDAVIHLAARVHVMRDSAQDPVSAFRRVNLEGTRRLAEQAAQSGVRRFIYMSTIKVNGERTLSSTAFREEDRPHPSDPYALSKWEAEQALVEIARPTHMEVVILRPPLVYGPLVKGNLLRLMQLIDRRVPLPFRGVNNRRSLVSVWNLADAVIRCLHDEQAGGQTYVVSDGIDLSTEQLVRFLAQGMGRIPLLFPVPSRAVHVAAHWFGQDALWDRLFGSMVVDSSKIRRDLNWQPPVAPEDGLRRTGQAFVSPLG